jgi:hypothetical protein
VAENVVVTDQLPSGVRQQSADPRCVLSGQTLRCTIGTLAVQATVELHVTVEVLPAAAGTTLVNTAVVSGGGFNPNPAGTTSIVRTAVAAPVGGLAVTGTRLIVPLGAGSLLLLAGLVLVAWYVRTRREV